MLNCNEFSKRILVVVNSVVGQKFRMLNDNLIVVDLNNEVLLKISCYRVFALYIIGDCTITSPLISSGKKYGFSIVFLSQTFRILDIISVSKDSNTLLRKKQYLYNDLGIAKMLTYNKIHNQIVILQNGIKNEKSRIAIEKLENIKENVFLTNDLHSLLAAEGNAARLYFSSIFFNYIWVRREPRVKRDYINSLLDIGYTILFTYIETILSIYGFDLYIGVYHQEFYMRKSLVCDLVEPFRSIIDGIVLKALKFYEICEKDFIIKNNQYVINWEKSKVISKIFFDGVNEQSSEIFKYIQKYYRFFMGKISAPEFPFFEVKNVISKL